jgi:sugar phosphate isomerase/epimerase
MPLHTAIHSYSFRDLFTKQPGFTIERALEMSADMGFTSMEVMTGVAGKLEHIGTDTVDGLSRLNHRAAQLGIRIHCYSTYNDFAFVKNENWRRQNVEYIKRWLKLAADTGVPNIRMLTGYHIDGEDRAKLERLVEDGIRECVSVAEECRVNMAVENHSTVFLTGRDIVDLIARVGSPRLTTCPDPSNGYNVFDAASSESNREAMYENLRVMAPKATNSHLKIKGVTPTGELITWDLPRLLAIYKQAGYAGPITFESIAEGDLLAPLKQARETVEAAIRASA